jgi:hypothetical protein
MLHALIHANKRISSEFNRRFGVYEKNCKAILLDQLKIYLKSRNRPRILEVGGIDRPLLARNAGMYYCGIDIEFKENCKDIYDDFFVQSIEDPLIHQFDAIISTTVLEHVKNNKATLNTCYTALNSGGMMIHYLPSKYHPYSFILRLVTPRLQKMIIAKLRPEAMGVTGYPAFFDLCSPRSMCSALQQQGFKEISLIPFYQGAAYFNFCFPLYLLVLFYERLCGFLRFDQLCSGFIFTARKE